MLFILTGDIQTGKTRWLQTTVASLSSKGVTVEGVLAPGVWIDHGQHSSRESNEPSKLGNSSESNEPSKPSKPSKPSNSSESNEPSKPSSSSESNTVSNARKYVRYEKVGIDNHILPSGKVIQFARRRDLALAEGSFNEQSQSAQAHLDWEISDDALARVNAHFEQLRHSWAQRRKQEDLSPSGAASTDAISTGVAPARSTTDLTNTARILHATPCTTASCVSSRLLVIDELGRLELECAGGLVEAVSLLEQGPVTTGDHALVIVRPSLVDVASHRFAKTWSGCTCIAPDDAALKLLERYMLPDKLF